VVADDGEQGITITMFQADRPDLVICDLVMPKEGGHFVISEIKREALATKVIAISGHAGVDGLAGAIDSGADEISGKPFDAAILLNTIKAVCR